jgi:hypothetical protein
VPALFNRTGVTFALGLAALGIVGIAGFALGLNARGALNLSDLPELSAADVVNLRFPNDWTEAPASAVTNVAYASADSTAGLLDPTPIFPFKAAALSTPSDATDETGSIAHPLAEAPGKPAPPIHSARRSNSVLNEAQIASIKRRLNLTQDQERYWPAVAAELRKMEYKRDRTQTAAVDMSKVNVEGLKSAGYPLVMSFNDEQRRELNSLAHLLGLESVVSNL